MKNETRKIYELPGIFSQWPLAVGIAASGEN